MIGVRTNYTEDKVTIIWAPQSETSAEGANCRYEAASPTGARKTSGVWLSVWGSVMSSPSVVRGGAPVASDFFVYIHIKSELIFGHLCISIRLQRWANRNKSGTPSQKWDKRASGRTVIFPGHVVKVGTVLENPGWGVVTGHIYSILTIHSITNSLFTPDLQELIRRWDSKRELFTTISHVRTSKY